MHQLVLLRGGQAAQTRLPQLHVQRLVALALAHGVRRCERQRQHAAQAEVEILFVLRALRAGWCVARRRRRARACRSIRRPIKPEGGLSVEH